jgi:hypothetical protein
MCVALWRLQASIAPLWLHKIKHDGFRLNAPNDDKRLRF